MTDPIDRIREIIERHRVANFTAATGHPCHCGAQEMSDHSGHVAEEIVASLGLRPERDINVKDAIRYVSAFTGTAHAVLVLPLTSNGGTASNLTFTSDLSQNTEYSASCSFRAKANTSVDYTVQYDAGSGCTTEPTYSVAPVLMQQ